jgi:hypothetical protein
MPNGRRSSEESEKSRNASLTFFAISEFDPSFGKLYQHGSINSGKQAQALVC